MENRQRTTDNRILTTDNRTRTHPTFNFQLSTSAVRRPLTVVRCHSSSFSSQLRHTPHHNLDEGCDIKMVLSERLFSFFLLHGQIVLAEVLAAQRQLMMLQVGQEPLQLKEETLARLVAVGVHVEGN